jgi:hypothetical protein
MCLAFTVTKNVFNNKNKINKTIPRSVEDGIGNFPTQCRNHTTGVL